MPNHGAARQGLAAALASKFRSWRENGRGARRRETATRLAFAEMDIDRLDDRIDTLLDVLAQLCDYSGQYDAADDFRALSSRPAVPEPQLRLVQGQ
jgi:hypothetical protein